MPTAKKDDINIVQIESEGFNQEKVGSSLPDMDYNYEGLDTFLLHYSCQVKVPVLAMRGGTDLQTYVDILVPTNAKLTLIQVCFRFKSL